MSRSRTLTHVDLNHTNVTTPAVVAMMDKHKTTLKTLDLSHTSIGDGTLRAVSSAKRLETLDISHCPSISRTSIRNFLTQVLRGGKTQEVVQPSYFDFVVPAEGKVGEERKLKVVHDAREAGDSVWGYRRYIEYLGEGPSLPERLGDEEGVEGKAGECKEREGGEGKVMEKAVDKMVQRERIRGGGMQSFAPFAMREGLSI